MLRIVGIGVSALIAVGSSAVDIMPAGTPDLLDRFGIPGLCIGLLIWLMMWERKEHKQQREQDRTDRIAISKRTESLQDEIRKDYTSAMQASARSNEAFAKSNEAVARAITETANVNQRVIETLLTRHPTHREE